MSSVRASLSGKSKDSNLNESIDFRVRTESYFIRGVFKTQSNIYDGAFL